MPSYTGRWGLWRRLDDGSRMSREVHVRFCERLEVKPLRPTHPYIRVKGRWTYLYRAVDSRGQTIDFLLSAKRDAQAAKRFFRRALGQPHTVNPRTITVDKNPAYPKAIAEMKGDAELWRFSRLRQVRFLNNIVEQDLGSRSWRTCVESIGQISGLRWTDSRRVPKPRQPPKAVLR